MFNEIKRPDYEGRERKQLRKNASEVLEKLRKGDKNLAQKIETFCHNFLFGINKVKKKIKDDKIFAATFTVPPMKQSFHEGVAHEWLSEALGVHVQKLPRTGKNAFYVNRDGDIKKMPKRKEKPTKSLDFHWEHGGKKFFAMHKYTRGSGGNQNNQFDDLKKVLRHFKEAQDPNTILFVIADGNYYAPDKMAELRRHLRPNAPLSFAEHIENVPVVMNEHYAPRGDT